MPPITRWYIKTSLLYFIGGLLMGIAVMANSAFELPAIFGTLRPVYIHMLIVGWLTQLIFGVALWMFPKYSKEKPRGSENLAWTTYLFLNVGLLLRLIGEPLTALNYQTGWMLAVSAVLQLIAGWVFVINTWGRVKER